MFKQMNIKSGKIYSLEKIIAIMSEGKNLRNENMKIFTFTVLFTTVICTNKQGSGLSADNA
jgi:hypothetical protein